MNKGISLLALQSPMVTVKLKAHISILTSKLAVHPLAVVMVSTTSYLSGEGKVCKGCCSVEVVPSSKSQNQETIGSPGREVD